MSGIARMRGGSEWRMPDDQKPADAGQTGGAGGGVDSQKPASTDVVERKVFRDVVGERDRLKEQLGSTAGALDSLRGELGGNVTVDDIKELKALREERAEAERRKLEDRGEFEKLLTAQKTEHDTARSKLSERLSGMELSLKREVVGRTITKRLVEMGVLPNAVNRAEEALLTGDGGVGIGMAIGEDNRHQLTLSNATGAWPTDEDARELTLEKHLDGFKQRNPFFFQPTVRSGAGGGVGDGTPGGSESGDPDAALNKALEDGDHEAFVQHRQKLFGLRSG